MANDVRTIILPTDAEDPTTVLSSLFSEASGSLGAMVRDDGETFAIILADSSNSGLRSYDARTIPDGTTAILAIGLPDLPPSGGTFSLSYDGVSTNTAAIPANPTAAELETLLNSNPSRFAAGPVTVLKEGADYRITDTNPGTRLLLGANGAFLIPLSSAVVRQYRAGSDAGEREIQILSLRQAAYATQTAFDPLPAAGYTLSTVQSGVADVEGTPGVPAIQLLTLDPAPYGGTFTVDSKIIPFDASEQTFANAYGGGVSVSKAGDFAWQFTQGSNGPKVSTVSIAKLLVPKGFLVTLNLSTFEFLFAFSQLDPSADSFLAYLSFRVTFPGKLPKTYMRRLVEIFRSVINPGALVSASLPELDPAKLAQAIASNHFNPDISSFDEFRALDTSSFVGGASILLRITDFSNSPRIGSQGGPLYALYRLAQGEDIATDAIGPADVASDDGKVWVFQWAYDTNLSTSVLLGDGSGIDNIPKHSLHRDSMLALWDFRTGYQRQVANSANASGAPVNLYPSAESAQGSGGGGGHVGTIQLAAPSPFGPGLASRWDQDGFQGFGRNIDLLAGDYILRVEVQSADGTAQKLRQQFNGVTSADVTIPATGKVLLSISGNVATDGSIGVFPLYTDSTNDSNDVLFGNIQLERGTVSSNVYPSDSTLSVIGAYSRNYQGIVSAGGSIASILGRKLERFAFCFVGFWGTGTAAVDATTVGLVALNNLNNPTGHDAFLYARNGDNRKPGFFVQGTTALADAANIQDSRAHVICGTYDGATVRFFVDDLELAHTAGVHPPIIANSVEVGSLEGVWIYPDRKSIAVVYNDGLTPAQIRENFKAFREMLKDSLALSSPVFTAIGGDSLAAGLGVTSPWPQQGINGQNPKQIGRNYAVSGSVISVARGVTLGQYSAEAQLGEMSQNFSKDREDNIFGALIGYNDLNSGASTATVFADWQALYASAKTQGASKRIGFTLLPNHDSGVQTKIDAFNVLARAAVGASCEILVDFAALFSHADALDADKFPDGTHPNQDSVDIMAGAFETGLGDCLSL